ncbi:Endonuclease/exonuclease/phosphatase [Lipomyces oligophaga]|uniref:Endonuclease/exonuclease/phosphatase n=1 Tax=Lipomyces oligophaga TaxID=45792 RepID=UPI0034CFB60F
MSIPVKQDKARKIAGNKGRPAFVTPEYIAAQRAKREQAKLERDSRNAELGIPVQQEENLNTSFIERPMLSVLSPEIKSTLPIGIDIKIMTYNVLGQALIRRSLFPTNGAILKWKLRSKILMLELARYNSDIMCLQEVDYGHLESFYVPQLLALGFQTMFHRGARKNHGLLICWKSNLFTLSKYHQLDYDSDTGYDIPDGFNKPAKPQSVTRNVALIVALEFKNRSASTPAGVIVATTHLFWHPHGTFERTRQSAILVRNVNRFAKSIDPNLKWPVFIAGDFNSLPFDAPYLSMTRPESDRVTERSKFVLENSFKHDYNLTPGVSEEAEEGQEIHEENDQELHGGEESAKQVVLMNEFLPEISHPPVPVISPNPVSKTTTIDDILKLHSNNNVYLRSLYGSCYGLVHPENVDYKQRNGEPHFSNWAHTWRGMLDYIFVVDYRPENKSSKRSKGYVVPGVDVLELLRLPMPDEMGPEPSGQPREGQYPSDHLCIMAKVHLTAA